MRCAEDGELRARHSTAPTSGHAHDGRHQRPRRRPRARVVTPRAVGQARFAVSMSRSRLSAIESDAARSRSYSTS